MNLVKFPAPDPIDAREALQLALDEKVPLTNVVVLSMRENGDIYHRESDGMTLAQANWLIDSYKFWIMTTLSKKED